LQVLKRTGSLAEIVNLDQCFLSDTGESYESARFVFSKSVRNTSRVRSGESCHLRHAVQASRVKSAKICRPARSSKPKAVTTVVLKNGKLNTAPTPSNPGFPSEFSLSTKRPDWAIFVGVAEECG